ncbi:MAG: hypothetical protein WBG73_13560 [Coleofasciculaceae cyanobacterium]
MTSKNQAQIEQLQRSSSTNIQDIGIDQWMRQVKSQMMAVLKKKPDQEKLKN